MHPLVGIQTGWIYRPFSQPEKVLLAFAPVPIYNEINGNGICGRSPKKRRGPSVSTHRTQENNIPF